MARFHISPSAIKTYSMQAKGWGEGQFSTFVTSGLKQSIQEKGKQVPLTRFEPEVRSIMSEKILCVPLHYVNISLPIISLQ